jgi:hypothetical protein
MEAKEFESVLKKFLKDEDDSYESLMKSMHSFNRSVRESIKENGVWTGVLKKQRATYVDTQEVMENYKKAVEEAGKAKTEQLKRDLLQQADELKQEALRAAAEKNIMAAKQNFAVSIINVTQQMVTGIATATTDLVKSMQSNTSGVGVASSGLKLGVDAAAGAASTLGETLGAVGEGLSVFGGKRGKIAGAALEAIGGVIGFTAKTLSDTAKSGIDILAREIEKAIETFSTAASAGAMFADGVTGLRTAAHTAGLSIVTMSNIVKNNAETLYVSGLNLGTATKKISGVFIAGGESFKRSLFNLGYSFEEQGALIAETMKYLSIAGADLRSLDDNTIRLETEKYAMNLKTISAITGEDAKKRMEDSRKAAANSLIQSELAKMDKATREQFIADLAVIPDELKTAVLQQRFLRTVVDRNANILMGVVPEMVGIVRGFSDNLGQGSVAMGQMRETFATAYRTAQETDKLRIFGQAAMAGVAGTATEVDQYLQKLTLDMQQGAKIIGATSEIATTLTAMKDTSDQLTRQLSKLRDQAEFLTGSLERAIDPHLPNFGDSLSKVNQMMITFVNDAGDYLRAIALGAPPGQEKTSDTRSTGGVNLIAGGATMGAILGVLKNTILGAATGIPAGPAGMALGAARGAVSGTLKGAGVGTVTELAMENAVYPVIGYIKSLFSSIEGKAFGGISSGPKTGYLEKLHGTEAVIPLPDGKTVPVNLTFPKDINYIAPEPKERMLFTRDLNLDKLTTQVSLVKNSIDELTNNMPTLTIPPEFKTSMELSNASLKEVIREQTVLIRDYNEKLERLLSVATDNKNINQQILNATY